MYFSHLFRMYGATSASAPCERWPANGRLIIRRPILRQRVIVQRTLNLGEEGPTLNKHFGVQDSCRLLPLSVQLLLPLHWTRRLTNRCRRTLAIIEERSSLR